MILGFAAVDACWSCGVSACRTPHLPSGARLCPVLHLHILNFHLPLLSLKQTTQLCAKECKGKALFGTQYGTECWCSDSKSGYDKNGEATCDTPCGGDKNQTCGGRFAMQVYEVPASSPAPAPTPTAPSPTPKPPSGGSFVCDGHLDKKGEVCCKVRFRSGFGREICSSAEAFKPVVSLYKSAWCDLCLWTERAQNFHEPGENGLLYFPLIPLSAYCSWMHKNSKSPIELKAACGQCGGKGCGTRAGLTGADCCIGNIMTDGPKCSVQGKAPCVVDGT